MAENPTYLLRREEERKQELESAVTELKAIYNTSSDKPKIKYFNGKEGIATIYNDIIKTGKNIVAFSNLDDLFNVMSGEWFTDYAKRRAARNVFFRGLTPRPSNSEQTALLNSQLQQWKILPTGNFFTELNIYDNKIALLNFRRLRGEIIEDQTFATTLKVVFENLWQSLPDKIPISNEIN